MVKIMKTWTCDGIGSNYYDGHPVVTLYENQKCPYCGRGYVDTSNIRERNLMSHYQYWKQMKRKNSEKNI